MKPEEVVQEEELEEALELKGLQGCLLRQVSDLVWAPLGARYAAFSQGGNSWGLGVWGLGV